MNFRRATLFSSFLQYQANALQASVADATLRPYLTLQPANNSIDQYLDGPFEYLLSSDGGPVHISRIESVARLHAHIQITGAGSQLGSVCIPLGPLVSVRREGALRGALYTLSIPSKLSDIHKSSLISGGLPEDSWLLGPIETLVKVQFSDAMGRSDTTYFVLGRGTVAPRAKDLADEEWTEQRRVQKSFPHEVYGTAGAYFAGVPVNLAALRNAAPKLQNPCKRWGEEAYPLAQAERQRQATRPGPVVRGTFSPTGP